MIEFHVNVIANVTTKTVDVETHGLSGTHLGVSKNKGIPKMEGLWRFIMENPIKIDDLGVPLFSETSIYILEKICVWIPPVSPAGGMCNLAQSPSEALQVLVAEVWPLAVSDSEFNSGTE